MPSVPERRLFPVGAGLLLISALHLGLALATGESLAGPLSIRRPILFFFAAGLLAWTFALTLPQLREGARPVQEGRIRALALGFLTLLPGLSMIGVQYWRGVESHFDGTAPLDLVSNALTFGAGAAYTVVAVELTRLLWRPGGRDDALGWGLRLGWALHLVATVACGWALGANEGAPGPRLDALFRIHALGAHSVQLLPTLAWLLAAAGLERLPLLARLVLATSGGALWVGAWGWLAWRQVARVDAPLGIVLALGAAVAIGILLAIDALRHAGWRARLGAAVISRAKSARATTA